MAVQQGYEKPMMKEMLHNLPEWKKAAHGAEAIDALETRLIGTDDALRKESAAAVEPVQYEIRVELVAGR